MDLTFGRMGEMEKIVRVSVVRDSMMTYDMSAVE